MFEKFQVGFDSLPDCQWAALSCRGMRAPHHALARLCLNLSVIENSNAICVGKIVCRCDCLDRIRLIADVVPDDPFARAARRLAAAKMQSRFQGPIVWFTPRLQTTTRRAALKTGVADCPSHVVASRF